MRNYRKITNKTVLSGLLAILIIFAGYAVYKKLPNKYTLNFSPKLNPYLLMVGSVLNKAKPFLLTINTSDFTIKNIDLTGFGDEGFNGINEARTFIVGGQYKLALATYYNARLMIFGSTDINFKNLKEEYVDQFDGENRVRALYIGDIFSNGDLEIVTGTRPNGILKYYENKGGKWSGTVIDKIGVTIHDIIITDSDGDGKNEIFVSTSPTPEIAGTPMAKRLPEWIRYKYNAGKWDKEIIWTPNPPEMQADKVANARYLFAEDFEGDGNKELVSTVIGRDELFDLIMLKWNGHGYSLNSQHIGEGLKIDPEVVASGDIYNEGKTDMLLPTLAGDALLLYRWQGNSWERQLLATNLIDEGTVNERVVALSSLDSSSGGRRKILYATAQVNDNSTRGDLIIPKAGFKQDDMVKFYLLVYDPIKKIWNRDFVSETSLPQVLNWGFFPIAPWR